MHSILARTLSRQSHHLPSDPKRNLHPLHQFEHPFQKLPLSQALPKYASDASSTAPAGIRTWTASFHGFASPFAGSLVAREKQIAVYLQPSKFSRMWALKPMRTSNRGTVPSSDVVLWSIVGANAFVFFLWQAMDGKFMQKHFTVSIDSILSGRLHTLLTAGFSQQEAYHLFSNMLGLYVFGSEIGMHFGGKYLLMLYLTGCIGGSLGHLAYYAYVLPWIDNTPRKFYNPRYTPAALGASGAITAITIFDILLSPKRTIYFQLLFPMPAALVGVLIIGNDLWRAKQGSSGISAAGHLGGAVVGLLAWVRWRLPWWRI